MGGGRCGERLPGAGCPQGWKKPLLMLQRTGGGLRRGREARGYRPHILPPHSDGRQSRENPKLNSRFAFVRVRERNLFYLTTRWLDWYLLNIWRRDGGEVS